MGGEGMEIGWLFHELCCPGKLRKGQEMEEVVGLRGIYMGAGTAYFSFLLDPGAHKVLFVPSKSLFPSPV